MEFCPRQSTEIQGVEPVLREYHSFSSHMPPSLKSLQMPLPFCKSLPTRMTIASDGSFLRCYNDVLRTDRIGKLTEQNSLQDLWYSRENLDGMLIMLEEKKGRIFCTDCKDRVCADRRTGIGRGKPFEDHARERHAAIYSSCNQENAANG